MLSSNFGHICQNKCNNKYLDVFTIFIHSLCRGRIEIFSDIMNFKDCQVLRLSGTSAMRLVVGVISAMVEKELGDRNVGFDSLKSRLNCDMEEKGIVAVCSHVISQMLHCAELSAICRFLWLDLRLRHRRSPHTTQRSEQWSIREIAWTRSELTAVY